METKRYALFVLLAGLATVATMALMIAMSGGEIARPAQYPNKQGFTQAIFWFEMVRSPQEVFEVLGAPNSPEGMHLRETMDATNRYDYLFLVCYPLLIASLFLFLGRLADDAQRPLPLGKIIVAAGLVLSAVTLFADAYENIQLLKLTSYTDVASIDNGIIARLIIATNVKSGAISCAGVLLVYCYALYFRKSWGILLPLLYAASTLLGVIALAVPSQRALIEKGASLGMTGWIISTIHGGYWFFKKRR
jgi:hypothetical protein